MKVMQPTIQKENERIAHIIETEINTEPSVIKYIKEKTSRNPTQQRILIGVLFKQADFETKDITISAIEKESALKHIAKKDTFALEMERAILEEIQLPTIDEAITNIENPNLYTQNKRKLHTANLYVAESTLQIAGVMTKSLGIELQEREEMITNVSKLVAAIKVIREKYPNPLELETLMKKYTSEDRPQNWTAATIGMLDAIYGEKYQYMCQLRLLQIEAEFLGIKENPVEKEKKNNEITIYTEGENLGEMVLSKFEGARDTEEVLQGSPKGVDFNECTLLTTTEHLFEEVLREAARITKYPATKEWVQEQIKHENAHRDMTLRIAEEKGVKLRVYYGVQFLKDPTKIVFRPIYRTYAENPKEKIVFTKEEHRRIISAPGEDMSYTDRLSLEDY